MTNTTASTGDSGNVSANAANGEPSAAQACSAPAHRVPLNYDLAAAYMKEHADSELTEELLLSVYRVMTDGTQYEGRGFKTTDNIIGAELHISFVPAAASISLQELRKLLAGYRDELRPLHGEEALRPVLRFVLQFVLIHPFADGNGRVAHCLLMYLLYNAGYKNAFDIPVDRILLENRRQYFLSILRSTARVYSIGVRDPGPYEEFMLGCFGSLLRLEDDDK